LKENITRGKKEEMRRKNQKKDVKVMFLNCLIYCDYNNSNYHRPMILYIRQGSTTIYVHKKRLDVRMGRWVHKEVEEVERCSTLNGGWLHLLKVYRNSLSTYKKVEHNFKSGCWGALALHACLVWNHY
jgi:hypothetical protein